MYARIQSDQLVEWPIVDLRPLLPNVSLPEFLTDDNMPEGFVIVHAVPPPVYDTMTHKLVAQSAPSLVNGRWEHGYDVAPLDENELALQMQALADFVRRERTRLLSECDWTQVADAPVDQAAWAAYRQQLRDVPAQPGFPSDVTWPNAPV